MKNELVSHLDSKTNSGTAAFFFLNLALQKRGREYLSHLIPVTAGIRLSSTEQMLF